MQDSYFYGTKNASSKSYGVESFVTTDDLIVNNVFQRISAPFAIGNNQGSVYAYNFSINNFIQLPTFLSAQAWEHDAGVLYNLFEGNIGEGFHGDVFHGTGGANTFFRNRWNGNECTGGICTQGGNFPVRLDSYNRDENVIGNVLGTIGIHKSYENGSNPIYSLGQGATEGTVKVPSDSLVSSTLLRWGNYDTVTGSVRWCGNSSDTGWSSACTGKSEVPTGLTQYANAVPSSTSLPASFYYKSIPNWWPSGKPWPPIGPDVSNGNLGACSGGSYLRNMTTDNSQCTPGGGSLADDVAGHANSVPAMDCYLTTMAGPPDGSGPVLSFNANACYLHSTVTAPKDLAAIVQ